MIKYLLILSLLLLPLKGWAWGKRGHALVAEAAAYALKDKAFLKSHSFDLAYYGNVPDILWKRPETNNEERDEHFVDLEVLNREMGAESSASPWPSNRTEFFKKYPGTKKAGFAFWRISELCEELQKIKINLVQAKLPKKEKLEYQMKWLSFAGILGHYVADLSQPLHTTENYDGQMSKQKGIHSFYETEVVNELYPALAPEVFEIAKSVYSEIAQRKTVSCFELARELAKTSHDQIKDLLDRDIKFGRSDLQKSAAAHRHSIANQMGRGAGYLSLIWSKYLDWSFDGKDFFNFDERPEFIKPASMSEDEAVKEKK